MLLVEPVELQADPSPGRLSRLPSRPTPQSGRARPRRHSSSTTSRRPGAQLKQSKQARQGTSQIG